jgi:hypothetical protein
MNAMTLSRSDLRKLLDELFVTDTDLTAFCVDHFADVARRFASGMEVKEKQSLLLVHADEEELSALLLARRAALRAAPLDDPRFGATRLFVTSDLWDQTRPVQADLAAPAGVILDRVVAGLGLPATLDHGGRVGVRLKYTLSARGRTLARAEPLRDQEVGEGDVLSLVTKVLPFAGADPFEGSMGGAMFRGGRDEDREEADRELLRGVFRRAGLLGGSA